MSGDFMYTGAQKMAAVPSVDVHEPLNIDDPTKPAHGLALGAKQNVGLEAFVSAPLVECTSTPTAEKLGELNSQSVLLGAARIGDKEELDIALTRHHDAKIDEKNPVYQDDEGKAIQDVNVEAIVSAAFARLEMKASSPVEAQETVRVLKDAIATLDPQNSVQAPVLALLEGALRTAQIALQSRTGFPVQLRIELESLQGKTLEVQLHSLSELSTTWQAMNSQVENTMLLLSGPDAVAQKAEVRLNGAVLLPEDAEQCRTMMSKAGAGMLREALADSPVAGKFSDKALELVARMTLESGESPVTMLRAVELAMQGVAGAANAHDIRALEAILDGMLTSTSPRDKAAYVDMLFMGAYPEGSDAALTLKKALVPPSLREGMSCFHAFVMSRHILLNRVFKGNSDISSQLSARTFLLTPDLANKMCGATGIRNFKYHMAHVAMLQTRAIQDGFLDQEFVLPHDYATLSPERQKGRILALQERQDKHQQALHSLTDMKVWGETLGLQDYVSAAGQRLSTDVQAGSFAEKVALAADRFNKGFLGDTDLKLAAKAVQRTAEMTNHIFSARYERNIYHSNPEFMAHKVLDDCIMNLTGILEPEKRLIADVNTAKNGEIVDAAIRSRLASELRRADGSGLSLKEQAMFGHVDEDIAGLTEYRDARLAEIKGARRPFLKHIQTMREMAEQTNELVRLRAQKHDVETTHESRKSTWDSLSFSWPHQKAGRTRVCKTVMQIANLHEIIADLTSKLESAQKNPTTDIHEQALINDLANLKQNYLLEELSLLRTLKGVDVAAMNLSGSRNGPVPDLATVLTVMRPRAEAVQYFSSGQAEKTLKQISSLRTQTDACITKMNELTSLARKVYGQETLQQLGTAIRAATLKVFVESGLQTGDFSVNDAGVRTNIEKQLARWGIQADQGYFASLVTKELYCLCDHQGCLREDALRWQDAHFHESTLMTEAKADMLHDRMSKAGFSLVADAALESDLEERRNAALRKHGIHTLLAAATLPGGGFVYDYKRGIAINTASLINTDEGELIQPVSLLPVSMQLGYLHSDALTVQNAGDGAFTVTLKSENAANIAILLGISFSSAVDASVGVGVEAAKAGGIYFRFPSQGTCEAFLNDFMNASSGLHKGEEKQPSWLAAQDIRLLHENSVSASLFAEFSVGAFAESMSYGLVESLLNISTSVVGTMRHTTSTNAHGVTDTFIRQLYVEAKANLVSLDFLDDMGGNLATVSQTFNIHTGMHGLTSESSMSMEMVKGKHTLRQGLALLHTPESVITALGENTQRMNELEQAWALAPSDATIRVSWKLRPETLARGQSLMVQARAAQSEQRAALLKEYHEMLGKLDAYEPANLHIVRTPEHEIAHNFSPSLLFLEITRQTSLTGLQEETFSLAPQDEILPPVEDANRPNAIPHLESVLHPAQR